jgi:hypothetical protein
MNKLMQIQSDAFKDEFEKISMSIGMIARAMSNRAFSPANKNILKHLSKQKKINYGLTSILPNSKLGISLEDISKFKKQFPNK